MEQSKKEKTTYGAHYEGYETDEGNTMSGAITLRHGKETFETLDEFLDFLTKQIPTWIKCGLAKNKCKQFVLVVDFMEDEVKSGGE